jgi:hypothetical protein
MAEIKEIEDDISFTRAEALDRCSSLVRSLIRLGMLIRKAEQRIPLRDWDDWLDKTLRMSPRLAAKYAELSEDTTPPPEIAKRVILGALNLNLSDEIVIPDANHIAKATDMQNKVLYIWPSDETGDHLLAIVFDGQRRIYECSREPFPASTAKEFLERQMPADFMFGNASYELLLASQTDFDRFNEMLRRHKEKALRQKEEHEEENDE